MVNFTPKDSEKKSRIINLKTARLRPGRNATLMVTMFARAYRPAQ